MNSRSCPRRNIHQGDWDCRTSRLQTNSVFGLAVKSLRAGLYQFTFAHSGWCHACTVLRGESFQALIAGVQEAVWMTGGVPEVRRNEGLWAAFNNLAEQGSSRPASASFARTMACVRAEATTG